LSIVASMPERPHFQANQAEKREAEGDERGQPSARPGKSERSHDEGV
jgi:hypothetical protein